MGVVEAGTRLSLDLKTTHWVPRHRLSSTNSVSRLTGTYFYSVAPPQRVSPRGMGQAKDCQPILVAFEGHRDTKSSVFALGAPP